MSERAPSEIERERSGKERPAADARPTVSLRELKDEVLRTRPPGDPLREVLLREPDELDPRAFAHRVRPWLALLRLAGIHRANGEVGP